MKKFINKLNVLQKTIFLEFLIGLIFMLISLVGVFYGQYGWLIGIAVGTVVSIISSYLMIKSSGWALKDSKTGLFILSFFGRMILLAGALVAAAVLQYVAKIEVFNYSIWGVLIGYTPMTFVTILIQVKSNKNGDEKF